MKEILDFRLVQMSDELLLCVEFELVVFTRYLHRLHDKLKFVGHPSQS